MLPEDHHEDGHLGDGHDQSHEEEQHHEGHDHFALGVARAGGSNGNHGHDIAVGIAVSD